MKVVLILIILTYITVWVIFFIKMRKIHKEIMKILDDMIAFNKKIVERLK